MKLIVAVVLRCKGEVVTDSARKIGASGATIILGKGTAKSTFLDLLGFSGSDKDIAYILCEDSDLISYTQSIKNACAKEKSGFGILFTLDVQKIIKNSSITKSKGEKKVASHTLITAILNSGLAEEAMAAARKVGASGGTIINARGTAKDEDQNFFGIKLVPEKEMLQILTPKKDEDKILTAIKELPCLQEKGSGIIFCSDADDFTLLGAPRK